MRGDRTFGGWVAVLGVAALGLAMGACGKKAAEAPAVEKTQTGALRSASCPDATPNAIGVGKPCTTGADCRGQLAVNCLREDDPRAVDFCTRRCFFLGPDECGPDALCAPQGAAMAICIPAACAPRLTTPPPTPIACDVPCALGEANALGVGKACETHAECGGNTIAKTCPKSIRPTNPNWCTMLCTSDADCGADAFCWQRPAGTNAKHNIASCTPKSCCKLPN